MSVKLIANIRLYIRRFLTREDQQNFGCSDFSEPSTPIARLIRQLHFKPLPTKNKHILSQLPKE